MSPPVILSSSLLAYLTNHPQLPPETWYFVAATALCVLNRPDEIATVFKHAISRTMDNLDTQKKHEAQLKISRRLRESLIKASAIGGMPKTINAIFALKEVTPIELQDEPMGFSPTSRRTDIYDVSTTDILQRGGFLFDRIYGKVAGRIMKNLDHSGTEDLGLLARMTYGYVVSSSSDLTATEASYVLIAGLIPQDVNPQLKGHLQGALNGGASVEEVRAVRQVVIRICEASGMKMIGQDAAAGWGWREEVANL